MTIDAVRKYWDNRPCNVRHSQIDIGADPLKYSQDITNRKFFTEPHILSFIAETPRDSDALQGKYVFDAGCGIGTQSLWYAHHGAFVYGVDLSEKSIEVARKRRDAEDQSALLGSGWRRPAFAVKDIEDELSFTDYFDIAFSFGVIHHTPNPEAVLSNVWRLLKPGGEFRLMVYNRLSWKAFWILATYGKGRFWKWKELIPKHSEAQTGCPVTHTYTKKSISRLLTKSGFTVLDMRVDHIFPYQVQNYVRHCYVREWYWRILPDRVFRWLEKHIGWHLLVVARKD